jgi:trans-2,3-dihydro-3-hydroxyanthranilate isomerase
VSARAYTYHVADVFTDVRFAGNMLAVFPDAAGLEPEQMQAIARELNLSETTFVLPPECGGLARVRIFTPECEMPFAGHPTIGTAFALAHENRIPAGLDRFAFEEIVGHVDVHIERRANPFIAWLRTPTIAFGQTLERAAVAEMAGLSDGDFLGDYPAQIVGAGNPFLYVMLRDAATVDRADVSRKRLAQIAPAGQAVGVFFSTPHGATFYSRMLAPGAGVVEDPATGSATGPLGAYLAKYGLIPAIDGTRFTNEQGVRMKRRSLIHGILNVDAGGTLTAVDVGGSAVMTTLSASMLV